MTDEPKTDAGNAAPAAAAAAAEKPSAIPADEMARLTDEIVGALKTVYDPEIPADIYELGLIYKVDIDDDRMVNIDMTLDDAELPVGGGIADAGRECGGRRARRARGQGQHRVGSAVGSEPDVGRGPHRAQYVVRQASQVARTGRAHYIKRVRIVRIFELLAVVTHGER